MKFQTESGNWVPDMVASQFTQNVDLWEDSRLNPHAIRVFEEFGENRYEGIDSEGTTVFVNERGRPTRASHYRFVNRQNDGATNVGGTFTFNSGIDVIHEDHFCEHVTKVIVVTGRNERHILNSRSGVLWQGRETFLHADEMERELAIALSDTSTPLAHDGDEGETPSLPPNYDQPLNGWHSSMEQSEQSKMMNALAKGDIPKAELDEVDPFPYVVRYGDTRNVCSVNASLYAREDVSEWFKAQMKNKQAAPTASGF